MNALSHEQAIELLHEAASYLSAEQRAALAAHLAECGQCRTYADQLSRLQPVLTHALRARRVPQQIGAGATGQVLVQHKRRSLMRKMALTTVSVVVIAVFAVIAVSSTRLPDQSVTSSSQTATPTLTTTTSLPATPTISEPENMLTPQVPGNTLNLDLQDELVDIGVAKLHIRCVGKGSPTVILNAGPGSIWNVWSQVMSEASKFARVCAYDRAGLGGSSPGPKPRTSQQMADELAALLERGNIPGPYVLVSHSSSNWIDRLYTAQHRDQVDTLVFVSPFHEDFISGSLAILAPYPTDLEIARNELAAQGEGQSVDDWLASADQVRAVGTLGDLPLILVARGKPNLSGPAVEEMAAMLAKQEQQLLVLSTNSVRLVADQSGHFIQRDQPQAVVDAIRLAIFEPNDDFAHATLIALNKKYDQLNFAMLKSNADGWDSDYFKVRVKPGMLITCRTSDPSGGANTNMILYDNNQNGIEGNDNVDRAKNDLSSSVTYTVTYEGWLYVLVGEGFSRSPAEAQQATYSLECSTSK